jgi:uncharacterized protein (DUF488 family)
MLFERQKRLLALLDAHGGEVGKLDFQKLLFLYCLSVEKTPSYDFVPYKYGGFSFTSYADKRRLTDRGLLSDEEPTWKLTRSGKAAATMSAPVLSDMKSFAKKYAHLRGDALVAEVYRLYPYYATRSEMAARVLRRDTAALIAIREARPASSPGLCTIGYEGLSLEAYLNRLLLGGVTVLCDVRRNPLSRKYGFSKGTLSKSCEDVGIRYEHLPELGIAGDRRRELGTQASYDALFAVYEKKDLPRQGVALAKIRGWIADGDRVALTCYERLPEQCHRHCVAVALEDGASHKWSMLHL